MPKKQNPEKKCSQLWLLLFDFFSPRFLRFFFLFVSPCFTCASLKGVTQWRIHGGPQGAWALLIFRQKWGPKGRKNFFWDRAPPYLRVWMTRPPSYLKVWIRHCHTPCTRKKISLVCSQSIYFVGRSSAPMKIKATVDSLTRCMQLAPALAGLSAYKNEFKGVMPRYLLSS